MLCKLIISSTVQYIQVAKIVFKKLVYEWVLQKVMNKVGMAMSEFRQ